MVNSFAMMHARLRRRLDRPIHRARHRSEEMAIIFEAIFGFFRVRGNLINPHASSIAEPTEQIKWRPRFDFSQRHSGDTSK
jgi:hypothetical protein